MRRLTILSRFVWEAQRGWGCRKGLNDIGDGSELEALLGLGVLYLRSEGRHNAESLKTLSPDSGTGKRKSLCFPFTVVFPSWTSRVRTPSQLECRTVGLYANGIHPDDPRRDRFPWRDSSGRSRIQTQFPFCVIQPR